MLNFSHSLEAKDEVKLTDGELVTINGAFGGCPHFGGGWHHGWGHHGWGRPWHRGWSGYPSYGWYGGYAPTVVLEPVPTVVQTGVVLPAAVPVC